MSRSLIFLLFYLGRFANRMQYPFRKAGFSRRDTDAFRVVVVFEADYGGCRVVWQGLRIANISFGSTQHTLDEYS